MIEFLYILLYIFSFSYLTPQNKQLLNYVLAKNCEEKTVNIFKLCEVHYFIKLETLVFGF